MVPFWWPLTGVEDLLNVSHNFLFLSCRIFHIHTSIISLHRDSWWYDVMNRSWLGSATWNCCSFPVISSFQVVSKVRCRKVLSNVKRVTAEDSALHQTRCEIISLFNEWCCWLYNALKNCRNDRNTSICLVLLIKLIKVKLLHFSTYVFNWNVFLK